MRQVFIRGGGLEVQEVPAPVVGPRSILVRVAHSCISAGTETTGVKMSGLPLYRRALKQPDNARRVLQIAKDEGFMRTYQRVKGMVDAGVPTGYSAAGTVLEVGSEVTGFAVGERAACAGAGVANHAELIDVPVNLAAKVPNGLSTEFASTVTLGAIALQGVRRAAPTLGETIGVIGLGIVGQLTAQLLSAQGCRVIGTDIDPARVEYALANGMSFGVRGGDEDFVDRAHKLTDGFGTDAVIITAATASNEVVRKAMQACRKKGRVVLVGDVGLDLNRADMYEKELDFLISTSYGPGRYDPAYEEQGQDYPFGYVRWTENRNMEAYLRLLADGRVSLTNLHEGTYEIDAAEEAYAVAAANDGARPLVLLSYPQRDGVRQHVVRVGPLRPRAQHLQVALVGAGGFAQGFHLPNLSKLDDMFVLRAVMSRTGSTARAAATNHGAAYAATDYAAILGDPEVDLVVIATRHDLHARMSLEALRAGKHVFVEKPLALTADELDEIEEFYRGTDGPLLMTGFNRRFSSAFRRAREILTHRTTPLVASYRMNAGYLPPTHWVHGPEGGGRNLGEACHIYDLFCALSDAEVLDVEAAAIRPTSGQWRRDDNFVATVSFGDGSVCNLIYTALGAKSHPKERMDIYADGVVLSLDDYRSLEVAGGRAKGWSSRVADKGHYTELKTLGLALTTGGPWPIPLEHQLRAMRIGLAVQEQLGA